MTKIDKNMKFIPKIILKLDIEEEVNIFYSFLHHKYFPANRTKILKVFPTLEKQLNGVEDEKKEIRKFLDHFYGKNKNNVNKIIKENKKLFEDKSDLALKVLGDLMDYRWNKQIIYFAIPTILPFSPFNKNTFYLSILAQIKGYRDETKNALSVGIHEISHFIFFQQLEELKTKKMIPKISKEMIHYIKESLTAVILNESSLQKTLGIKNYKGNPELWELYFAKENNKINFNDLLKEFYEKIKIQEKKSFVVYLERIIKHLQPYDHAFQGKWGLWSKIGMSKNEEKEKLIKIYSQPIH